MVTVVNIENKFEFVNELNAMHRHRKEIFVDFLKWNVPVIDGQYEIDQFDNENAVYLLALDEKTGAHLGSVRLLPSTAPHLLHDLFPYLCDGPVPIGEDIWEITRLCTAPRVEDPKLVRGQLATALMEFGLLFGVRQYTSVAHMAWLSQVLAAGWDCQPLGLPQKVGKDEIGAIAINVTANALQMFRQRLELRQPLLRLPMPARAA